MKPLISAVIPTYNCRHYITEAITSLKNQSIKDLEIIVVDDGSDDGTHECLKPIIKENIIKYVYQPKGGVSKARNKGIDIAIGEFIVFLDADDVLLSDSIQKRLNLFKMLSELSIVYSDHFVKERKKPLYSFGKENKLINKLMHSIIWKEENYYIFSKDYYSLALKMTGIFPCTITIMFKKNYLNQVGHFDETMSNAEDLDLWIRAMKNQKIGYIDEPLAIYYRSRSKASLDIENDFKGKLKVLYKTRNNESNDVRKALNRKIGKTLYQMGSYYKYKNDKKEAFKYLLKSLKYRPFNPYIYYKIISLCI